jgi:hypothetical protein
MRKILSRLLPAALLAAVALAIPQSVQATPHVPKYPACDDFDVSLSWTGGTQDVRMTRIKDGILYTIVAGKGTTITVTNAKTGESVTFDTKGSITRSATDLETGEIDWSLSGANLVLLFDKVDVGGPSTILYSGVVKYSTDSNYTLTESFQQQSGTQRNICAELS